jgi:hypothetical protein
MVHAVDEIDIGMAGRAEHGLGPRREPLGGVRGQIVRAQVGLDFDDAAAALDAVVYMHQVLAQQRPRHGQCLGGIEGARQLFH